MIRNKKTISINILSAILILISLFIVIVGQTNSWFTSVHYNGVRLDVFVGGLKYELYQVKDDSNNATEVYTYDANKNNQSPSYVELEGEIKPEVPVDLELILKNDEIADSSSMYIKFMFKVYVLGVESDLEMASTISGFEEPTANKPGFIKGDDDYYYLVLKTGEDSYVGTKFEGQTDITLMQSFTIGMEEFLSLNGSESVRLELSVEASVTDYLSVT